MSAEVFQPAYLVIEDFAGMNGALRYDSQSETERRRGGFEHEDDAGGRLDCWFNPTTLVRARRGNWKSCTSIARSVQPPQYQGGTGDDISLELLLHAEGKRTGANVKAYIDVLFKLLDASETATKMGQSRPPTVTLHWGKFTSEVSIVKSVTVKTELFDLDGTPLRATASLTLSQYEPGPGQATPKGGNPTTRATQARRAHRVRAGDNVHLVAYRHLRDPSRWRDVADANGLDDPLAISSGEVLVVPMDRP
jgi:hypothetical protein